MSQFEDRLAKGVLWILSALLFAMAVVAINNPENWIGLTAFGRLTLIGFVASPTIVAGVYILGTIAEYVLRVVSAIRREGSV